MNIDSRPDLFAMCEHVVRTAALRLTGTPADSQVIIQGGRQMGIVKGNLYIQSYHGMLDEANMKMPKLVKFIESHVLGFECDWYERIANEMVWSNDREFYFRYRDLYIMSVDGLYTTVSSQYGGYADCLSSQEFGADTFPLYASIDELVRELESSGYKFPKKWLYLIKTYVPK